MICNGNFISIYRWFRRGWITFERDVKIKEICYSLNNIRLRDFELGPIVNRDLSRRIRTVNGITVDRKVVRNDIKLAGKSNSKTLFKCDVLPIALLRIKILPSFFSIETKLPQNLDKNINSLLISTKFEYKT